MSTFCSPLAAVEPELAKEVYRCRKGAIRRIPRADRPLARLFDGRRPLLVICEQTRCSLTRGLSVADRLTRLGLVERVDGRNEDGFSTLDETFFASEVGSDLLLEDRPRTRVALALHRLLSLA